MGSRRPDTVGAGLFREEALSRLSRGLWPAPLLSKPLPGLLLASFVVLTTAAVIVFATSFPFARKERVAGYLTPVSGWSRVTARTFAVVRRRHVDDGDFVEAGDVLYEFASGEGLEKRLPVERKLLADIAARRDALRGRLAAIDRQLHNDRTIDREEREALRREITHLESEVAAYEGGLAVKRRQYRAGRRLRARGAISESDLLDLLDRSQSRAALVASKRRELARLRAALESHQTLLTRRELEREETRATVEERILGLAMEQSRIQARDSGSVLAPRRGRVASVRAAEGDWVQPGDSLLDIVPDDYQLKARLFADSNAMGSIRAGQEVRVYLDAFPYERHGAQSGRVLAVSGTTLGPRDTGASAARSRAPAFRIDVEFPNGFGLSDAQRQTLRPGMTVTADIVRDRATLIDWLIEPLQGVAGRL